MSSGWTIPPSPYEAAADDRMPATTYRWNFGRPVAQSRVALHDGDADSAHVRRIVSNRALHSLHSARIHPARSLTLQQESEHRSKQVKNLQNSNPGVLLPADVVSPLLREVTTASSAPIGAPGNALAAVYENGCTGLVHPCGPLCDELALTFHDVERSTWSTSSRGSVACDGTVRQLAADINNEGVLTALARCDYTVSVWKARTRQTSTDWSHVERRMFQTAIVDAILADSGYACAFCLRPAIGTTVYC